MPTIQQVTDYLESIAPLPLQESYDNAGLIVGHPDTEVTGVLTTLDCLESTIDEAVQRACNLVVAHHPIVFRGLKRLNGTNYVERTVIKAIRKGVAIYAIHTNLDNIYEGVNAMIAQRLDLRKYNILVPKSPTEAIGSGMIGWLPEPMSGSDFLSYVSERMQAPAIRHTRLLDSDIHKVAVCGGAGSFTLSAAIAQAADVLITADFKYHEFFDADGRILICDIGHYESEQFTTQLLAGMIRKKFSTFAVLCTDLNTNPVRYYYSPASK